jgi:nucleoside-diphosphate-sugar epimerase
VILARRQTPELPVYIESHRVDDIGPHTNLRRILDGIEIVVHTAALAHKVGDRIGNSIATYRQVNTDATLNLARQAASAGVKRMIFFSTIGVHGPITRGEKFSEDSPIAPHSPYALSKYEAELGLRALEKDTDMEISIIRPPLIYGNNPPGNLARLIRLISREVPLPFGLVKNKRTLVSLENIIDLVMRCIQHPKAGGETFLAGDTEDVSTPEIISLIAEGMGRKTTQLPVPAAVLRIGTYLLGRSTLYQQLCGSLQIDTTKSHRLLDWAPTITSHDGLIAMGRWYRENVGLK